MNSSMYLFTISASGFLMGCVFDIYNTILSEHPLLRWLRTLADLLFWLVFAVWVYHFCLVTDEGRFRIYTLGILLFGYVVYRLTLRKLLLGSVALLVKLTRMIFRIVWRIVYAVVIWPLLACWRIVWRICSIAYSVLQKLENMLVTFLTFGLKILFWPLKRPWEKFKPMFLPFFGHWEGFWTKLSNMLKHPPNAA
ncbi:MULTISPECIES: spore cortex biosynthesis protein YabQ [Alicyclobacillus]|nr:MULTISPECIES: spore cortex biosynthesis protein YabQ [Alicyclobacillus]